MRILYGVQATGNGHITRSLEIIGHLRRLGHEVTVVLSGRDPKKLWDVAGLAPMSTRKGFTFVTRQGRVRYLATAVQLDFFRFGRDVFKLDLKGYDLAISDFEPVTAYAARLGGLFCLGLGHQYALGNKKIPLKGADPLSRLVLKVFAPVNLALGFHYHHFGQPILPPVIPSRIRRAAPVQAEPGKVLVYLPFETKSAIRGFLAGRDEHDFYIYHDLEKPLDEGRLHWRPFSRATFPQDMLTTGAVIANAGFQLTSEALHLGKKLLVRPLAAQFEQASNALALEKLGLGRSMDRLDPGMLGPWLASPPGKRRDYPDVALLTAQWIDSGHFKEPERLIAAAWDQPPPT